MKLIYCLKKYYLELTLKPFFIIVKKKIGRGTFGMVYYAKLISCNDMEVAVKSPIKKEYNIVKEYKILSKMGTHPNIVKLVGIIHNEDVFLRNFFLELYL